MRILRAAACAATLALPAGATAQESRDFAGFLDRLRAEAPARGISERTLAGTLGGMRAPDADVIARIGRQGEFVRPVWDYLVGAVTPGRIARGQALSGRLSKVLAGIEARTGVPRWIILAFWGVESDFGASPGTVPAVPALASLCFACHTAADFCEEVWAALRIVERGDIAAERLKGSWAGALGQPQFLPSVYLQYGTDGDGDGRADIWTSQADALASIGAYLKGIGWDPALSWGYEVRLPRDFDLARYREDFAAFARRGVVRTDGRPLPATGSASLFLPGGTGGPAFLLTRNFDVIRIYNTSDSYALTVGHLADRLSGAPALAAAWPGGAPRLDRDGLLALQRALSARGLYAGEIDGRAGPKLRDAVRSYQIAAGLPADGYATPALLERLRAAP